MKIWLVTIGEPLPLGISKDDRLYRAGQLARFLAAQGHEVVWWTSTFDHFRKQHHFGEDTSVEVAARLTIRLLKGCGYSRNISVSRLLDHFQLAGKFAAAAAASSAPNVIIASLPTVELSEECVKYGRQRGIPVVLDMRDMWPDILVDAVPKPLRALGRLLLGRLHRQSQRACGQATAITGVTEEFVNWGLRRGQRQRTPLDRAFPFTYPSDPPPADKLAAAEKFWDDLGVPEKGLGFTVCYFGSVSTQLDLAHAIEAARALHQRGRAIRFVLCGRGDRLEEYRRQARDLPNAVLPGWMDGAQIWTLMRRSSAGLDPLPDRYDFLDNINNKAVEYLSAGLPIIASPRRGVLCDLVAREACGLSYSAGSAGELAAITQDLEADPAALARMSERAQALFDAHFAPDAVHTRIAEYLTEVVASTAASRSTIELSGEVAK